MKRLPILLLLLFSCYSFSQTNINMVPNTNPANPQTLYSGCEVTAFNDDGGNGNYSDNFSGIAVFCPIVTTDRMILDFRVLDIEVNDVLTIYDGDDTTAPVLATVTNTNVAPGAFQASPANPTGCLTVQFVSNGSGNGTGWRAARSCFDPCQTITTNIVTTPATDPDGILRICQGDTVTFDGQATFSDDDSGATYEWDLANGGGFNPGQVQTETYAATGIYQTKLRVTDNVGCTDREEIDLVVQVSSDPDFSGTIAADTQVCFGESTTITGVATTQEFAIPVSPPITGTTFLPDGSGVSYTTCINVDLFAPGAVITNASDIVDIFVNMEHSFLGDLQLTVSAPNGSSVDLHSNGGGGGTFLGVPIDDDNVLDPGTGFDYVFTESATQTWLQASNVTTTIPAGDYLPVDPYSSFLGSPLNGQWCITITDNLRSDNGYIFFWGLNFNPAIIPAELSFTPEVVAEGWQNSPDITNNTGNIVTITPTAAGQNCYTYEMTDNHGCTYTEEVCIDVLPEILSASPNDIIECNTTGATTTADLTVNDAVILNGLPAGDHSVTYHNTQANAENGVNAITNVTAFPINTPPVTVFSAITNTVTNCIVVDSFIVDIIDLTTLTIPDFEQCGPISNFDLNAYVAPFLNSGGSGSANFTNSFYTSLQDAQNETNPIMNPDTFNLVSGTVTIYVRIVSNTDPGCNTINSFSLTATVIPIANAPANMVVCDDLSNDGEETFVLSDQDAAILNGQAATVTYHLTQLDAIDGIAPLNAAGYQNISNPQTVFARVTDNSPLACSETTSFDLVVNRRAVFTVANDMIVCDDVTNDGIAIFDLTSQDADILGSQTATENT
ncbi:MAG: PKD domain-containing protein, partial [Nonlabens sp.]|uniref:PKD domain-containing protein n=1 Tax=Nonlabens sp. TaxID=1888209 RepID=UPI0032199C59